MKEFEYFPVHIHVAKSAGTYILSVCSTLNKFLQEKRGKNLIDGWVEKKRVRKCSVDLGHNKQLTVCYYTESDINEQQSWKLVDESNPYVDRVDKDLFINALKENHLEIFSISINPIGVGFDLHFQFIKVIENITGRKSLYFLPVRNPLYRAVSLFFYLSTSAGSHETSYLSMRSENIINYLLKEYPEENYLARCVLNLKESEVITKKHSKNVLKNLKNVYSIDISKVDELLDFVFLKCYDIKKDMVHKDNLNINKHMTPNKKFDFESFLRSDNYKIFLEKTEAEHIIYNELKTKFKT